MAKDKAYKANDYLERRRAALFIFGGIACIAPNLKSYDNIRTCARVVKVHNKVALVKFGNLSFLALPDDNIKMAPMFCGCTSDTI